MIIALLFQFLCGIEINPFLVNESSFMLVFSEKQHHFQWDVDSFVVGMIGAARVLADEGEKAAPIIALLLDFLPVALNSPIAALSFPSFLPDT